MLSNFVQLSSLIYERAPNKKQICYIVSRLKETRESSDHVGKLQKLEKVKQTKKFTHVKENIF